MRKVIPWVDWHFLEVSKDLNGQDTNHCKPSFLSPGGCSSLPQARFASCCLLQLKEPRQEVNVLTLFFSLSQENLLSIERNLKSLELL